MVDFSHRPQSAKPLRRPNSSRWLHPGLSPSLTARSQTWFSGTASAGTAGTTVFLTDWTAPSTGRFYIAVGSEGTDRTGTYWLSITTKVPD